MYNYKSEDANAVVLKDMKDGAYQSSEFLELEKNLMGIVDEDDIINKGEITGSPSTMDSFHVHQNLEEKEESAYEKTKNRDKYVLSTVLRENWTDCAVRFKFAVFDRILNENKAKGNVLSKSIHKIIKLESILSSSNSAFPQFQSQHHNQFGNNNKHNLYEFN